MIPVYGIFRGIAPSLAENLDQCSKSSQSHHQVQIPQISYLFEKQSVLFLFWQVESEFVSNAFEAYPTVIPSQLWLRVG